METKLEQQCWDSLDICRGGMVNMLEKGSAAERQEENLPGIFMVIVKEDIQRVVVTEENAKNRVRWREMCVNP